MPERTNTSEYIDLEASADSNDFALSDVFISITKRLTDGILLIIANMILIENGSKDSRNIVFLSSQLMVVLRLNC